MESAIRILIIILVAYGCYALLLFVFQRSLIYPGRTIRVAPEPVLESGSEKIWLVAGPEKVEAWFLPGSVPQGVSRNPVIIFFHGNGEVIDFIPGQLKELRKFGLHVLLVEYPGYGRSGGSPSEPGIAAVAVAAHDEVSKRPDVDAQRIIAFGRSLGGGAACALSLKRPIAALLLQSTFTSTRSFARRFLLPGFLVRDVFDNISAVRSFPGPIFLAHGRNDDIIPFSHGEELSRAGRDVSFVNFDCSHNDCPPDLDAFWRSVAAWLKQKNILPGNS